MIISKTHIGAVLGLALLGAGCQASTVADQEVSPVVAQALAPAPAQQPAAAPASNGADALKVIASLNDWNAKAAWPVLKVWPKNAREVAKLPQSLCPPNPDGICGAEYIFSEAAGQLYVKLQGGAGADMYGPIGKSSDLLPAIAAVAKYVQTLKF